MLSVETLIHRIEAVADHPQQLNNRELVELCQEYGQVCERLNDRLLQCALYLRRGYLSEAVRLCNLDQNLLVLITLVGMPKSPGKRDQWVAISQQMGIPVPAIRHDLAQEINRAFARNDVTSELAARMRRQQLLRRPLSHRRKTLEALDQLDPTNRIWRENLMALEQNDQDDE